MAFLTVSSVVAGVGGVLSNIASGAIAVIKVVASVAFAAIFALAIITLIGGIENVVFGSVVGEVFGIFWKIGLYFVNKYNMVNIRVIDNIGNS